MIKNWNKNKNSVIEVTVGTSNYVDLANRIKKKTW
jgi:hypothetical protein